MFLKKLLFPVLGILLVFYIGKDNYVTEDPIVSHRDTNVNPADDFFMYANGGWFKNNPIPSTEKTNGIFRIIQDTINNQIK